MMPNLFIWGKCFPPYQAILRHQLGGLQLNSDTISQETVLQDCPPSPTSDTNSKSRWLPVLLTD